MCYANMRSHSLWIAVFAILFTDTRTQNPTTNVTIYEGKTFTVAIMTVTDVKKCYLESPHGETIEFIPNYESSQKFVRLPNTDFIHCHANVTDVQKNDNGLWTLHAEYDDGRTISETYYVTVNPLPATTQPGDRLVREVELGYFNSSIGGSRTVKFDDSEFIQTNSCSILTPSGMQHNLQGLDMVGIEMLTGVGCGVTITVTSEDHVGNWTLISIGTEYSEAIERRFRFNIHVEEFVDASVSKVTLVEGKDLYIHLKNPINNYSTCRLIRPDGNEPEREERDSRYNDRCGYIVRNMKIADSGRWEISFGDRILYRALVQVTVTGAPLPTASNLVWTKDRPVVTTVGPENAIYCRLIDPRGHVEFEGFGRCNISLDRVNMEHSGVWKIAVGVPGEVLLEDSQFTVSVVEGEPKAIVNSSVIANKPTVSLTCSVSSPNPVHACKFRAPSGRILLAPEGTGESRFSFHGAGGSYQSGVHTHDCGLLITNPVVEDLGRWRCALDTKEETYYGFLTAKCPWKLRDPEIAATVIFEPRLTADRREVSEVTGDSVTMMCSIDSAIRYCYFRARNGTVFNVGPDDSHDQATYVGGGFDAGECGIRFPTLAPADSGDWSCHVGFPDMNIPEQRAGIEVTVHDLMTVFQRTGMFEHSVGARVYDDRSLDYCRFIRNDGYGFIGGSTNMPSAYTYSQNHAAGSCSLEIRNPSTLDLQPWTIVTKIRGQAEEISRVTASVIDAPSNEAEIIVYYRTPVIWIIIMAIGISLILVAMLIGPKQNRDWAYGRASALRNSFRGSYAQKAVVQENVTEKNSPTAA